MAKIGFLCLKKGVFHNKRIVSKKWLEESTKVRLCCGEKFRNMAYGYLWWIIDENEGSYAAIGNSGNVIYVNADKDLVISIAATFKPAIFDRIEFIKGYIEPFAAKQHFRRSSRSALAVRPGLSAIFTQKF